MIVQSRPDQSIGRVVLQADHAGLASQLALAFGNARFQPLEPAAEMQFLALNHDRGWDAVDPEIRRNPATGLPYSLVQTPLDLLLASGPDSVAFNRAHHPYCGLLAAMHIWGLFHGRYGLSDKVVVSMLEGDARVRANVMLSRVKREELELLRQLSANTEWRRYVTSDKLMQNYKLLQFFDTLSLYLNEHVGETGPRTHFLHVPLDATNDCSLELAPLAGRTYRMAPFPFAGKRLELKLPYWEVPKLDYDVDYRKFFAESHPLTDTIELLA